MADKPKTEPLWEDRLVFTIDHTDEKNPRLVLRGYARHTASASDADAPTVEFSAPSRMDADAIEALLKLWLVQRDKLPPKFK
jgi:hypothetical protein